MAAIFDFYYTKTSGSIRTSPVVFAYPENMGPLESRCYQVHSQGYRCHK